MKSADNSAVLPTEAREGVLPLLREQSLNTLVRQEIECRITSGMLAAGAKLNEMDFSSAPGVSRGPLREALCGLGQAGLVRTEKNHGVFLRRISQAESDEIYEVRASLEVMTGRLAAQRRTPAQLALISSLLKRMCSVSHDREVDAHLLLNLEFHDAPVDAAGNATLSAHNRRVVNQVKLLRCEMLRHDPEKITRSSRERQAVVMRSPPLMRTWRAYGKGACAGWPRSPASYARCQSG